ncbi:MAG: hypothetical protein IKV90_08685 [Clostridia bacterium]|nr:hypothetical protein [Clostridia bacterium]
MKRGSCEKRLLFLSGGDLIRPLRGHLPQKGRLKAVARDKLKRSISFFEGEHQDVSIAIFEKPKAFPFGEGVSPMGLTDEVEMQLKRFLRFRVKDFGTFPAPETAAVNAQNNKCN